MASEILFIIFFFITMIVLIVNYFKTRHTERMALINSNKTSKIFDAGDDSKRTLKLGLFLLSVGLGLLIGLIADKILGTEPAGSFISILILGGISLILYYSYIERNKNPLDANKDDLV
jgi:Flp pilus assembly protein TadB